MILEGRINNNKFYISFFPNGVEIEYTIEMIIALFENWATVSSRRTNYKDFIDKMNRNNGDTIYYEMPEIYS